jgi:glycosyltransferase involved in cell wall biosynthesis
VAQSKSEILPKISIIIPVYNVEQYLAECLDSVVDQTLREIEIICVNDGSTDSSREILEQYASRDSRLKIIDQPNSGLSAARNRGLDEARGEYIQFLDSDDFLKPQTCQRVYEVAHRRLGGYDFIGFDGDNFSQAIDLTKRSDFFKNELRRKLKYAPASGKELLCRLVMQGDHLPNAILYVSKRLHLIDNRIRFTEGVFFEDNWFTYLNLMSAKHAMVLQDRFYQRRFRTGSIMTSRFTTQHIVSLWILINQILNYVNQNEMTKLERAASIQTTYWASTKILEFIESASAEELAEAKAKCDDFKLPFDFYPNFIEVASDALRTQREISRVRQTPTFRIGQSILWVPRLLTKPIRKFIGKVRSRY